MFQISNFSNVFKETIIWMLKGEHRKSIKDDIKLFINNKKDLNENDDSIKALKLFIELVLTQSYYLRKPASFEKEFKVLISRFGEDFRTHKAQNEILSLIDRLAQKRIKKRVKGSVIRFLRYSSIKEFVDDLHNSASTGGDNNILGEKGRDNFLRDLGCWDRAPIDRHEERFLLRTGIYHTCSEKDNRDPLQKESLHKALSNFCSIYLKGFSPIYGIDLETAPGIVNIFIWYFCAKGKYSICGSTPKCKECPLKKVCLYGMLNK